MKKYAFLLVMTVTMLPLGLRACDCGCDEECPKVIHLKDGLTPNGPVTADAGAADAEYYTTGFGFRDYGPARVTPPPPVVVVKRPNS